MTETRLVGDSLFYTKRLPKGTSIIFSLVDDNAQDISSAAMKTQTEDINDVERDTWYYFYQADGPASQNKKGRYKDITYQINQRIVSGVSIPFRKPATGKTVRYNLAGQRVSSSYKGIVIENGRKVIVH